MQEDKMLYLLYVTAPSNTQSIQSVEFGQSIEMDLYKEENKERRNRRVEEKTYGYMLWPAVIFARTGQQNKSSLDIWNLFSTIFIKKLWKHKINADFFLQILYDSVYVDEKWRKNLPYKKNARILRE